MKESEVVTAKARIELAFLELLNEKPYLDITVTEIIKKAEVARMSYYRNFSSVADIVDSITDRMASDFLTELIPMFDVSDDRKLREFLFNYFYQLSRNYKKVFPANRQNQEVIMNRLHDKISKIETDEHLDSIPEKYGRIAKMSILDGVGHAWLRDGMKESPEEMIDYTLDILKRF